MHNDSMKVLSYVTYSWLRKRTDQQSLLLLHSVAAEDTFACFSTKRYPHSQSDIVFRYVQMRVLVGETGGIQNQRKVARVLARCRRIGVGWERNQLFLSFDCFLPCLRCVFVQSIHCFPRPSLFASNWNYSVNLCRITSSIDDGTPQKHDQGDSPSGLATTIDCICFYNAIKRNSIYKESNLSIQGEATFHGRKRSGGIGGR